MSYSISTSGPTGCEHYSHSSSTCSHSSHSVSRSSSTTTDSSGAKITTIIEVDGSGQTKQTIRREYQGKVTEDVKIIPGRQEGSFEGGVVSSDGRGGMQISGWHGSSGPEGTSVTVTTASRSGYSPSHSPYSPESQIQPR
ncbi:uncharacterized protein MONOS_13006 [Monocercomonoides exilis]|uniref:uncharacterized protein n=1 Tax=Monocercomonoides exilis TaxID=2049356 RepID=UPI00355A806A|nr:hypothetical protein MONOS_13006 [Monocercomonoides exilis]